MVCWQVLVRCGPLTGEFIVILLYLYRSFCFCYLVLGLNLYFFIQKNNTCPVDTLNVNHELCGIFRDPWEGKLALLNNLSNWTWIEAREMAFVDQFVNSWKDREMRSWNRQWELTTGLLKDTTKIKGAGLINVFDLSWPIGSPNSPPHQQSPVGIGGILLKNKIYSVNRSLSG